MQSETYRNYVKHLKSQITQDDLRRVRTQIDRSRRRKTAKKAGKGFAIFGALALGTVGMVALARAGSAAAKK